MYRTCTDSYATIRNLSYHFKDEYINVTAFDTPQNPTDLRFEEYDIVKNNGINRIYLGPQMGNMGANMVANMQKVPPRRR
jgi:coproporphyrinogen III oxidase-like Fe-S oxidoreductase